MKHKKFLFIIGMCLSTAVFAGNNQKLKESGSLKDADEKALTQEVQSFSIPPNSKLTVTLLDDCWAKREDRHNQKIIADYLMTFPAVTNSYEIAWKTSRLVYFIGNFGVGEKRFVDSKDGVKLFNYGAEAGKIAYKLEPNKVEGYYWYAVDLGSYGLAKGILSAASNAGDGMDALKKG